MDARALTPPPNHATAHRPRRKPVGARAPRVRHATPNHPAPSVTPPRLATPPPPRGRPVCAAGVCRVVRVASGGWRSVFLPRWGRGCGWLFARCRAVKACGGVRGGLGFAEPLSRRLRLSVVLRCLVWATFSLLLLLLAGSVRVDGCACCSEHPSRCLAAFPCGVRLPLHAIGTPDGRRPEVAALDDSRTWRWPSAAAVCRGPLAHRAVRGPRVDRPHGGQRRA